MKLLKTVKKITKHDTVVMVVKWIVVIIAIILLAGLPILSLLSKTN